MSCGGGGGGGARRCCSSLLLSSCMAAATVLQSSASVSAAASAAFSGIRPPSCVSTTTTTKRTRRAPQRKKDMLLFSTTSRRDDEKNGEKDSFDKTRRAWFSDSTFTTTTTAPPFPPPEDSIALSGDVLVLFVYTYLDHSVNEGYVSLINKGQWLEGAASDAAASAAASASAGAITVMKSLPVWFDATHNAFGNTLSAITPLASCHYAPALTAAGPAFIFLTLAWLCSGQVFGAFLYQNTLECPTPRVLQVVVKAWIVTAYFMILLALCSHAVVDQSGFFWAVPEGGGDWWSRAATTQVALTKADVEYIVDSLSVLVMWRFVLHHIMGGGYQYGSDNEEGDKDKDAE